MVRRLSTLVLSLVVSALCLAQGTSGTISGTVTDSTGAVIPNATVQVVSITSGYNQTTQSDAAGQFQLNNVPFNHYHVAVTAPGFTSIAQDVLVRSASNAPLGVKLAVAGSSQSITVETDASDVVNNDPTSSTAVDRDLFSKLPLESTSSALSSLITLNTPGIVSDSNGLYHPLGEHADTTYSIDGQPVSDQTSRVFGNQLSVNAIQSVNVINGIAPPEYGDKASLVVQTTTRSGLNQLQPTGSASFSYGSFGSSVLGLSLGLGTRRFGNFISLDGVNSGRYLDTPEFQPLHAHGNNEDLFDRIDFQASPNDTLQLNLGLARSWFQNPNQFDQQAAGQDQRAEIFSYNVDPSWTHILSPNSLFSINPYLRQDNFHYFPSRDVFSDTPITLAQSRRLQNAGIRADLSYAHGIHSFKGGLAFYHTFLNEGFSLGVTDPTYNAPCNFTSGGADPASTDPANCPIGDVPNPSYNSGTAAADLTRGGSLFHFGGRTDIKQEAVYLQDNITWRSWAFLIGGRFDNYNGLSRRSEAQPRIGITYNIKPTNTVLRFGYGKLFLTPYNENLITSSSTGIGGLEGAAGGAVALKPASRSQYDAGFEQGFSKHVVVTGEYFWKYTARDFDFDTVLNTPLAFPIQWSQSKIDGFGIKVSVPVTHGVSAYAVLGHTRSRFFGPQIGGILNNNPNDATLAQDQPFRIDHDQSFQQSTHLQYQPKVNGPWYGITWRYESGLVAGNAPFATSTNLNPAGNVDLTYLTADQQNQILLSCGGVRATLTAPLAQCAPAALSSSLLSLPKPFTENDDRNPPRVAARTLFDMAFGWDNVLHNVQHSDRIKTNLSLTAINVTNKYALYNFLSTFSGTHFVSPRTVTGQVSFNF